MFIKLSALRVMCDLIFINKHDMHNIIQLYNNNDR